MNRRGFGSPDEITLPHDEYVRYRTAFAVTWLARIMGDTWHAAAPLFPEQDDVEVPEDISGPFLHAVKVIAAFGMVPITLANEYSGGPAAAVKPA